METYKSSEFRKNLFSIIDHIIQSGLPVEILKNGHKLKLILDEPVGRNKNLKTHNIIVGDPEELVGLSFETEVNLDLP